MERHVLTRLTDMFVAVRRDTRELTAKKVRGHFRHFSQLIPKENVVNEFSLLLIFLAGGGGGGRGGGGEGGGGGGHVTVECIGSAKSFTVHIRRKLQQQKNHKTLFIGDMLSLTFYSNMAETSSTTSIINTLPPPPPPPPPPHLPSSSRTNQLNLGQPAPVKRFPQNLGRPSFKALTHTALSFHDRKSILKIIKKLFYCQRIFVSSLGLKDLGIYML